MNCTSVNHWMNISITITAVHFALLFCLWDSCFATVLVFERALRTAIF